MKAPKALTIILACTLCLTALLGCQKDNFIREKFYGVVKWSEYCNHLVVYIPTVGEVEIPECDRSYASFDGYEENEDASYQLKEGDLIAINFKYEKSWDENSVKIMKTFPGRFDRKASIIEALKENVSFEKTDSGYLYSFDISEQTSTFAPGDQVYFVHHKGYNGFDGMQLLAEGTVTEISEGKLTVALTIHGAEEDFLENLMSSTLESQWEE